LSRNNKLKEGPIFLSKSRIYTRFFTPPVGLIEAKEFIRNMNLEFQRRFCVQPSDVEESENYSVAVMSAAMKILTESSNTTPI
jgi:hypothetical protein